jgi:hypothetical protein
MRRFQAIILCVLCAWIYPTFAQSSIVSPVHVSAGQVLTFYLQTRLTPSAENPIDALPKGTVLRVRLLDAIDSITESDGTIFHGVLESPLTDSRNGPLVEKHAEVRGLLVLLRSKGHPDGFRYELLLTGLNVNGKTQDLTATLNPSLFETDKPARAAKPVEAGVSAEPTDRVPPASGNAAP